MQRRTRVVSIGARRFTRPIPFGSERTSDRVELALLLSALELDQRILRLVALPRKLLLERLAALRAALFGILHVLGVRIRVAAAPEDRLLLLELALLRILLGLLLLRRLVEGLSEPRYCLLQRIEQWISIHANAAAGSDARESERRSARHHARRHSVQDEQKHLRHAHRTPIPGVTVFRLT